MAAATLAVGLAAAPATAAGGASTTPARSIGTFTQTAVVADRPGVALVTDPDLVNPWGVAFGPTTPLWTANNGTSTSTLNRTSPAPGKLGLTVTTPPAPTGIVFNDTDAFRLPDGSATRFLFDGLTGQLAGWGLSPATTHATVVASVPGAAFTALALQHTEHGPLLYAADAAAGVVRVYDGDWHQTATLTSRRLPAGLAPYGVAVLDDRIYVSYAPPPGVTSSVGGVVDVFNRNGQLQRHLIVGGRLNGPWGMVIAPSSWGPLAGALLVGNEDGGQINAFDRHNGRFLGSLADATGQPVGGDGLWGMAFGNGVIGTPNDLVVAIGSDGYQHGLVALIRPTLS
jgi:uncharacterized protein (TIGR03118 family)